MRVKSITLCADDYSFTPEITSAIIELIDKNRLSAVSCMVNTASWHKDAERLKPYINKVDVGLHFTLTDVLPCNTELLESWKNSSLSHIKLILQAYTKKLNSKFIQSEIKEQIGRFQKALGILPHFIDGHQHIHQLPVIRDALLTVYQEMFTDRACYIRIPISEELNIKTLVIRMTGGRKLKNRLLKKNIPFNTSFSGVYNFANAEHYPTYFRQFLANIKSGGLIMCHPALQANSSLDSISQQRCHEYNYLNSDKFLQDCKVQNIQVHRFQK